ncbi:MAG: hypothetical protein WC822_00085 [Candidatus Paceibacterota bacterium]|jgi:hypothetical protein
MNKKFEITNPLKKRFSIISSVSNANSKKFEIKDKTPDWFQQTNSYDCGPCLILNALRRISNVKYIPKNIEEVRRDVNKLRSGDFSLVQLAPNGWFTSQDVSEYLIKFAGLEVKEFACFTDETELVSQNIHKELENILPKMIYSTLNRHFRGFIPTPTGYEVLDSFNDCPKMINIEEVNEMISESINQSTPTRVERIGIVR